MMEFMVEIVITAFAFGGILGAVVALHLSANLKESDPSRDSTPISLELPRSADSGELKPVPVDSSNHKTNTSRRRQR